MITGQAAATSTTGLLYTAVGHVKVFFKNEGPNTVFIGQSGVSITTGYQLKIDEEIELVLPNGTVLHGVCDTAETATLHYLMTAGR